MPRVYVRVMFEECMPKVYVRVMVASRTLCPTLRCHKPIFKTYSEFISRRRKADATGVDQEPGIVGVC